MAQPCSTDIISIKFHMNKCHDTLCCAMLDNLCTYFKQNMLTPLVNGIRFQSRCMLCLYVDGTILPQDKLINYYVHRLT